MGDGGVRFEDGFAAMRKDAYRVAFGVLADRQLADDAASEALIHRTKSELEEVVRHATAPTA